jgi:cell division protein FtsA
LNRHNGDDEIKKEELMRLEQEMENLVLQPGLDILHVIPQDYTIDGEEGIRDPEGRIGVRVECNYHIITGETSRAKIIGRAVKNAHLEVADLIVEPVASATAVLSQDEMEAGVVLVDIGGGTTDICIFENGFISHTAIIPIGGDRITMDLQEAFGILKIQAEEVKVLYGSCFPTEQMKNEVVVIPGLPGREPKEISVYAISQVIRARMEDIINKVEFEIVLSGVNNTLNGGIVLTGGGSSLKEVKQLFSFETGFDVHIGTPGQHLGRGQVEEVRKPLYATAIGLVMKGIEIEHAYGSQFAPNQLMDSQQSQRDVNEPELEIVDDSQTPPQKQQKQKGPSWKSTYNMSMFSDLLRQWFSDEEENDFK